MYWGGTSSYAYRGEGRCNREGHISREFALACDDEGRGIVAVPSHCQRGWLGCDCKVCWGHSDGHGCGVGLCPSTGGYGDLVCSDRSGLQDCDAEGCAGFGTGGGCEYAVGQCG